MVKEARANETKTTKKRKKVIIGVSGSSGIIYGIRAIEFLSKEGYDTYVIITKPAIKVAEDENGIDLLSEVNKFSKNVFTEDQIDAPMASSSFTVITKGMIIIPCSINTLAYIASGITSNLLTRTAINFLRTKGRLVLVIRETPLGEIELQNALKVTRAGGIIMPASPGFYTKPKTVDDIINFIVGKSIDLLGIRNNLYHRWSK
ncbi:UbiX family flavin prenyltransferase [Acidianus manzaensis]|nr:UbiX family flavin prenyltransferase [Acidianus manzaensis]